MTIGLIVLAKSDDELSRFSLAHVARSTSELVLLSNAEKHLGGLGQIANRYFNAFRSTIVGIAHADTFFGPGSLEAFAECANKGAVCGIVGRGLDGPYVWSRQVRNPETVSTLDSCAVFMRKDNQLTFDEVLFDDFHCCVEDLCLQAHQRQIPVLIPPSNATHDAKLASRPKDWITNYHKYRARLEIKWKTTKFSTT